MEARNRSGNHSGGVVKNRSSSGCLIIKKKNHGASGVGSSKGPKLHESKKEKKRPRLNAKNSESSDEEFIEYNNQRRGVTGMNRVGGSSLVYESNDFDEAFGRRDVGPKRSQLDVYDFDEYDDLSDIDMMRSHYYDRGVGSEERRFMSPVSGMNNGSGLDFEGGSSKGDIIYKRRNSFHGGSSSRKFEAGGGYYNKRKSEMRNELPVSMGKEKLGGSDEAIRLQGKNGVLKVRVKHKEEISDHLSQNYRQLKGSNIASRSQQLSAKNSDIHTLPYSKKNLPKKPMANDRIDKNHQKKRKSVAPESSEEGAEEGEDSDSPPKLQTANAQVQQSIKRGRSGGSMHSPQTAQPAKAKEGKVKRGSGTEKQLLREKIRSMLVGAGWTIDYRPRRGRDYFDAVYVNPSGTAYWSIIKAYDALQKQLEEEGNIKKAGDDCSSFAPISEDALSKLTRQTRKKIEKELKRKKREEAGGKRKKEFTSGSFEEESDTDSGCSGKQDDKLSSFMRRSGKSVKGGSKESCREANYSNSKMQERNEKQSSSSYSRFTHARNSKKIGRCTLLVRNSKKGLNSESDGFIPYAGKSNLLSWLIDSGTVKLSEKVHYMNRRCTRVMLEGWVTREGIHCGCCSKILTVSKFEIHAASKLRQPYQNIYLSSGASLMQCQVDAWNKQEESLRNGYNNIDVNGDDPNDDTCAVCGDGGNLICCDSCPSTFHQNCLSIEMLPAGDWHCPHCSCKFCGLADMSVIEGNERRLDSVVTCSFCEGKFHRSCVEELDGTPVILNDPLFCGNKCQELYEYLQKLLGVKHELEAGLCWSLIHRTDLGSDTSVRSYPQKVEWNSKLAIALNVMDECFLPIIDRRSGINMIHSVLYNSGSNITRLDYSGFYTAILEKGDEIVAAASIRIRSTEFAEMPFIGTRNIYRRQGMCSQLLSAIETALRSLKIENLIIPAISELMDTWTTVFGFNSLQESDKQDIKIRNMLVFPGTDMLLKKLFDQDSAERGLVVAGANTFQNYHNASFKPELRKQSDIQSSPGLCNNDDAEPDDNEMKEKYVAHSGSQDTVCTDETFNASFEPESRKQSDLQSLPGLCNDDAEPDNDEMKEKSVAHLGSQDTISTDETSVQRTSVELCEEFKPSLSAENEEIIDKSVGDLSSRDIGRTDENLLHSDADCCEEVRPPLPCASPPDFSDNKSSSCIAIASVSDEVKPLHANEGNRDTTSAELQLDSKFNESSVPSKDKIFTDASENNFNTENSLDHSAASHFVGVSGNAELTEGTNMNFTESVSYPADGSVAATLLNGFAKNDDGTLSDRMLISDDGSAAYGNGHSLLEASHPDVEMGKPMIESTADDGSFYPPEVEVDDANVVLDVGSGSLYLNVCDSGDRNAVYEPKIYVTKHAAIYEKDPSLLEQSHVDVEMDNSQAEGSICQPPVVEVDNADIVQADTNVCSSSQPLQQFPDNTELDTTHEPWRSEVEISEITEAREALHSNDLVFSEPSHVDVEMVKPPADDNTCPSPEVKVDNSDSVQGETNVCSGSQSLHLPENNNLETDHEPNIHVSRNDVGCSQIAEGREALIVDDTACEAPHIAIHSPVGVEKPQSDSCGGKTEQPTLDDDAADALPDSNIPSEVSVDTIDSNTQRNDDPPSISNV